MKFLLDTCFISELIKQKPNKGVVDWLQDKEESTLYLSALTLGEVRKGISKLPDSKKKKDLIKWLFDLEKRFENRIIPINSDVSLKWGQIQGDLEKNGKSMPTVDAFIASSALVYNLAVVTHNGKDIKRSQVEIIDPWE